MVWSKTYLFKYCKKGKTAFASNNMVMLLLMKKISEKKIETSLGLYGIKKFQKNV